MYASIYVQQPKTLYLRATRNDYDMQILSVSSRAERKPTLNSKFLNQVPKGEDEWIFEADLQQGEFHLKHSNEYFSARGFGNEYRIEAQQTEHRAFNTFHFKDWHAVMSEIPGKYFSITVIPEIVVAPMSDISFFLDIANPFIECPYNSDETDKKD